MRRVRFRVKKLLMRVPAVARYISEKHVIAAERDQAIRDRDSYRALFEMERAAKDAFIAERDALLLRVSGLLRHGSLNRHTGDK